MQITIGIADLKAGQGNDTLVTYALGSCIGICLYDAEKKIGGLAHIMLPLSSESASPGENLRRFADTGLAELITIMKAKGANINKLTAKIAGGAQMFSVSSAVFNIGDRNIAATKKVLAERRIRLAAEETGSNFGRTVYFHVDTGIMEVRAANKPVIMR